MTSHENKRDHAIEMHGGTGLVDRAVNFLKSFTRREDRWANASTGLGTSRDKRMGTSWARAYNISANQDFLINFFIGNDLARKIVEIPAEEATREWAHISVQDDNGKQISTAVMQKLRDLGAQKAFADALALARLFGGSAILLGVDDGKGQDEPLDLETIEELKWIRVIDRWALTTFEWYEASDVDFDDEGKIGFPKTYKMTDGTKTVDIHESRLIRFDGVRTPDDRWRANGRWADSVFEGLFNTLRNTDSSFDGVGTLMQDASQGVYKIKNLANLYAADNEGLVNKRLEQLDLTRSVARAIAIDAEGEDFERMTSNFNGLSDILDRQMMRLSAGADIPVTRLFGRSAAGMNATGEGDEKNFQNKIRAMQVMDLDPRLRYLISIIFASSEGPTGGQEPQFWSTEWNSLNPPTEKEEAETRKVDAETDKIRIDTGVLSRGEVRESRYGGDDYGTEIILDESIDVDAMQAEKEERAAAAAEAAAQAQQDEDDRKQDAPNYQVRNDSADICSNCDHSNAGRCERWEFRADRGHGCDDFSKGDPSIQHTHAKRGPRLVKIKRLKGRNV